jgi:hypothetical protein
MRSARLSEHGRLPARPASSALQLSGRRTAERAKPWRRCGGGEFNPGADVARVGPVPAQMTAGEPSPGADVDGEDLAGRQRCEPPCASHSASIHPSAARPVTSLPSPAHAVARRSGSRMRCRSCRQSALRTTLATSAPGLGLDLPHLHRDWAEHSPAFSAKAARMLVRLNKDGPIAITIRTCGDRRGPAASPRSMSRLLRNFTQSLRLLLQPLARALQCCRLPLVLQRRLVRGL